MILSRGGWTYRVLRCLKNRVTIVIKRVPGVHPTASIHRKASISRDLHAEEYAFVGMNCWLPPMTTIGSYSMLAPEVAIVGGDHEWDVVGVPMQFTGRARQSPTIIGSDVWIGRGSLLSRGITVGNGAIIGAGSVVTRDIPPYEIWAGNPARKLRDRFDAEERATHDQALVKRIVPKFAEPLEQSHG